MDFECVFLCEMDGVDSVLARAEITSSGIFHPVTSVSDLCAGNRYFVYWDPRQSKFDSIRSLVEAAGQLSDWVVSTRLHRDTSGFSVEPLLVSRAGSRVDLLNELSRMDNLHKTYRVLSRFLPEFESGNWSDWIYVPDVLSAQNSCDLMLLLGRGLVYVDDQSSCQGIPFSVGFFKARFSTGLDYIRSLYSARGDEAAQNCLVSVGLGNSRTLFVFPERMLPIKRAYYMRAFDVLSTLAVNGVCIDVLVFGPGNKELDLIGKCLVNICSGVHVYPLVRGKFSNTHRMVRGGEIFIRKMVGVPAKPPMRFVEREMMFGGISQVEKFESIIKSDSYNSVILTGAWFVGSVIDLCRSRNVKVFVDLHDVFFQLDADSNRNERRFFYNASAEKKKELSAISSVDYAIAISVSDARALEQAGCRNSLVCSGNFEYSKISHNVRPVSGRVFGFIGSGNMNNQACVRILRDKWLPRIFEKYPDAEFLVAGGICDKEISKELGEFYPGRVRLLGFVDDVRDFYAGVNVILCPIDVQGGLNFKSVEALMAARVLITNELGARCIGNVSGFWTADDDGDHLGRVLDEIERCDLDSVLLDMQSQAIGLFGEKNGYRPLLDLIGS
jgi:hypothetical protein